MRLILIVGFVFYSAVGYSDTTIVYGNGVNSNGIDGLLALIEELQNAPGIEDDLDYAIAINSTQGLREDLAEALIQDRNTDTLKFILFMEGYVETEENMAELNRSYAAFQKANITNDDLNLQVELYRKRISEEGKKVLLVAHSQGNFFGNLAYGFLDQEQRKSFGIVGVATPDDFVADDGPYVTSFHDRVINGLRLNVGDLAEITPLPANTNPEINDDDITRHGFVGSYMWAQETRQLIVDHIVSVNSGLLQPDVDIPPPSPAEYLLFQEGNPATPGDGVTISSGGGVADFMFTTPIRFGESSGIGSTSTFFFQPPDGTGWKVEGVFVANNSCFENTSNSPIVPDYSLVEANGVTGFAINSTADVLDAFLGQIRATCGAATSPEDVEFVGINVKTFDGSATIPLDAFAFGLGADNLPAGAVPSTANGDDTVFVNGREWYQPDLFTNLTWIEINAVCPTPAGVCDGELNGNDMTGWTWASVSDVNDLFNHVIGGAAMGPGPTSYTTNTTESQWAPLFALSAPWRDMTHLHPSGDFAFFIAGLTSSFDGRPGYEDNVFWAFWADVPPGAIIDDQASTFSRDSRDYLRAFSGAWFHR